MDTLVIRRDCHHIFIRKIEGKIISRRQLRGTSHDYDLYDDFNRGSLLMVSLRSRDMTIVFSKATSEVTLVVRVCK